ncbi:hypothetical protein ACRALDRAFT_1066272, partial [Sodiomyces alcalophilus JCM 7366]|uniref:uncharacterized protein n=1 Tax=Sodiomyces alcalophilus JCM 7366 TaxID=591952 RepID=UPI0039B4257D
MSSNIFCTRNMVCRWLAGDLLVVAVSSNWLRTTWANLLCTFQATCPFRLRAVQFSQQESPPLPFNMEASKVPRREAISHDEVVNPRRLRTS